MPILNKEASLIALVLDKEGCTSAISSKLDCTRFALLLQNEVDKSKTFLQSRFNLYQNRLKETTK